MEYHAKECNCEITDLFEIDDHFISKDEYDEKNFCKFRRVKEEYFFIF